MPKFRKKPVVIEAEQFFEGSVIDGVDCLRIDDPKASHAYYIDTLEGRMYLTDGDWIITGVKGEKYPCKPDIFEATYEPVEEGESCQTE